MAAVFTFQGMRCLAGVLCEKDLGKNQGESTKTKLPHEKIKYLVTDDGKREEGGSHYKLPDLSRDIHVKFAKNIILNSGSSKRDEILMNSKQIVQEFREKEEAKIVSALSSLDIE